jgi:hypothetical protein
MSILGSTITRSTTRTLDPAIGETEIPEPRRPETGIPETEAPASLADLSCWRLLTARVPLTLLLDLAVPSAEELAELYDELLDEPTSLDWVPAPR